LSPSLLDITATACKNGQGGQLGWQRLIGILQFAVIKLGNRLGRQLEEKTVVIK